MSFDKASANRLYYRICSLLLFFVAAAASFNGFYGKWHFREAGVPGGSNAFRFDRMVDGTATRPYVYRQLLPASANWLDRVVPERFKTALFEHQGKPDSPAFTPLFDSPIAKDPAYFFRYLVVYVMTFLSAWIACCAMYLVCKAVKVPAPAALISPLIVILLLPYFMSIGGYFYDYSELAFMALAVWMALSFGWGWMIPLVALATWNKESFLFFVLTLYPLIRLRTSRLGALCATAVLCLVSVAVYLPLRLYFAHNPGDNLQFHLSSQLHYFMNPRNLFVKHEATYGVDMIKSFNVLPLALLAWTVWRGWRLLPRAIQRHGQIAAAINFPLFFLFCAPGELRNLSMLYVLLLLLVAFNLAEWIENKRVLNPGPRGESVEISIS